MLNDFNKQRLNDLLSTAIKDSQKTKAKPQTKEQDLKISHSIIGKNITQNITVNSHNRHIASYIVFGIALTALLILFF